MLTVRWKEVLSAHHDVVRVAYVGNDTKPRFRVVIHKDRSWRIEERLEVWAPLLLTRRNPRARRGKDQVVRWWPSPQSAMRFVENRVTAKAIPPQEK